MRVVAAVVAGVLACAALGRCMAPDPSSRTGGLSLEIAAQDAGNVAVLYRVEPDGTLAYGGGLAARARRTTWTGRMSDGEIERLRSLLESHGWFEAPPATVPGVRETRIRMRWPEGRLEARIGGDGPDLRAVQEYLDELSRRRFQDVLDSLPQPDVPPDA